MPMDAMRTLRAPADHYYAILSFYVQELQSRGKKVCVVTFNRPYEQLKEAMHAQGVADQGLFIVDSTGADSGHTRFLPDAMFVGGPNQLEVIAMRTRLVCQRLGSDAHVVVDSMNLVAQYNSIPSMQEFAHTLVNGLRAMAVPADFMVVDTVEGDRLADALALTVDGQGRLAEPSAG